VNGSGSARRPTNQLRIIGGQWRGRRLSFPDVPGLRPSPDRVRETLFNWLRPVIEGARCLDLFAGSGALGFEALSRGAAHVVFVDRHMAVVRQLREHAQMLATRNAEIVQADVMDYLGADANTRFDVVFVDPPYAQGLLVPCCQRLVDGNWLRHPAHLYLEAERALGVPSVPAACTVSRSKQAGQVGYHLAYCDAVTN